MWLWLLLPVPVEEAAEEEVPGEGAEAAVGLGGLRTAAAMGATSSAETPCCQLHPPLPPNVALGTWALSALPPRLRGALGMLSATTLLALPPPLLWRAPRLPTGGVPVRVAGSRSELERVRVLCLLGGVVVSERPKSQKPPAPNVSMHTHVHEDGVAPRPPRLRQRRPAPGRVRAAMQARVGAERPPPPPRAAGHRHHAGVAAVAVVGVGSGRGRSVELSFLPFLEPLEVGLSCVVLW